MQTLPGLQIFERQQPECLGGPTRQLCFGSGSNPVQHHELTHRPPALALPAWSASSEQPLSSSSSQDTPSLTLPSPFTPTSSSPFVAAPVPTLTLTDRSQDAKTAPKTPQPKASLEGMIAAMQSHIRHEDAESVPKAAKTKPQSKKPCKKPPKKRTKKRTSKLVAKLALKRPAAASFNPGGLGCSKCRYSPRGCGRCKATRGQTRGKK